uniref:Uncharacterized protein n=1 Tax=Salix viminalis TaxID=40686 RepID=A0A6N2M0S8_SALVM
MSVVLLVWTLRKPAPQVPCFFVFGDCLFDEGINNHLNTPAKVNNLTYGIDFFTGASGRSDFVNWRDGAHFTEAIYKRQSPKDAYPYDIKLAKLELDDSDAYDIIHAQLGWRRRLSKKR